MESLIGTIKSYLRIGSQNYHSKSSINRPSGFEASKSPGDPSNKSYHQMPDDAIVLTSIQGRQADDIESQDLNVEGIYVRTKVSTSENGSYTSRV